MHWLCLLLASLLLVGTIVVVARARTVRRRFRAAPALIGCTVFVLVVVAPTLVMCLFEWEAAAPYAIGGAVVAILALVGAFAAAQRSTARVERPKRILVVGAHPDDLEIACGGSLARFVDYGHEVHALVLSHGARGGHDEVRADEAVTAAEFLALQDITVRDFTDTRMSTEIGEMIQAIEAMIGLVEPDIVLTHSKHDQHQDHHAVHLATLRAARRCSTILCFESPSVTSDFTPRFFVDVSGYLDVKAAAVREHANQAGKPYLDDRKLTGRAIHRGEEAKVDYAEGYEVVRIRADQVGSL